MKIFDGSFAMAVDIVTQAQDAGDSVNTRYVAGLDPHYELVMPGGGLLLPGAEVPEEYSAG